MKEKMNAKSEMTPLENARRKPGVFSRFLQWISKGTAKAAKNGSFCNT